MNFIDYFSGIGGFRRGMELAGHKCVGFCEFDKYAVAAYTSMHCITEEQREYLSTLDRKQRIKELQKEEYRNGEWFCNDVRNVTGHTVPKADCWCFGAPCFTGDTLITTSNGLVPISDIAIGDYVLTHNDRFRKVIDKMINVKNDIYKLKVSGSPLTECTGNHRFYVRYRNRDYNVNTHKYEINWTEPEWKEVKDFTGKEYICFPHNTECKNVYNLTKNECWLIGRYIADGSLQIFNRGNDNRVSFCVGNHKRDQFENVIGDTYHVNINEKTGCATYTLSNKRLFDLCDKCGHHADEKCVPGELMDLPSELLEALLDGYMSGDGCITNGWSQAITVSKKLAYQIPQIVIKLYNNPSLLSYKKRKEHMVLINGIKCNAKDYYHIRFHKDYRKLARGYYFKDDLWMPVKKVEHDISRIETVYNLEVEEDHSYVANNLAAHNCQDFSVAGERKGLDGDRSSLIREIFRILREQKEEDRPEWLIYENVRGMLSSNNGHDFLAILSEMASLGYDIEYELLNSTNFGVPQNRERVYTVGHLRRLGRKQIFPLERADVESGVSVKKDLDIIGKIRPPKTNFGADRERIFSEDSLAPALRSTDYKEPTRVGIPVEFEQTLDNNKPVCLNPKGGRGGIEGLQPSLKDRVYDSDAVACALATSDFFNPSYAISVEFDEKGLN